MAAPTGQLVNTGDVVTIPVSGPVIAVVGGTYSAGTGTSAYGATVLGTTIFFEASPDGGTTWISIMGTALDNADKNESSELLKANESGGWQFNLFSSGLFTNFRIRAGGPLNGTLNVWLASAPGFVATASAPRPVVPTTVPVAAPGLFNGAGFDLQGEDLSTPGSAVVSVPQVKQVLDLLLLEMTRCRVGLAEISQRDLEAEVTMDEVSIAA